jgi:DNA-binding GntR family transcriptional regulator
LLTRIADGTYGPGDRLPTESDLCERYGLARGTVRQALERLRHLGMIERHPGVGTTVIASHPVGPYQPFVATSADIATLAATTRLKGSQMFDVVLDSALAHRMGARVGSRWHVLQGVRVRRHDPDPPLCWSEHYTRGDRPSAEVKAPFTAAALAGYHIEQRVSAALLDAAQAAALGAPPGAPALVVTRRITERRGRLINVGIYTHPADRYQIVTSLAE